MSSFGWPAVPDFHPEFGFLCPSPRRRRGMRLAVIGVLATMAIGATMGLALAHRTDGEEPTATAQPMDEQPPAALTDISISSLPRSMSPAGADPSPVTRAQESCKAGTSEDMAALFLNPSCGTRKPHAKHGARATNRVATVILGRMDTLRSAESGH
jgi:hypothetical protein